MSNSFLYNAPAGVVGTVTRAQNSVVESVLLGDAFTGFGLPAKFDSAGKIIPIEASDTAADFKGILVRNAPSISGNTSEGFADGIPSEDAAQGLLRSGFINVKCAIGTPVKGGIVYMRVVADTGKLVGDLEATADGANNVALSGVEWAVSGKDANNITELYVK